MPPYLVHIEHWKSIWPILLTVGFVAFIVSLSIGEEGQRKELFLVSLSFSMLGMVTGYITGFSREPAVGAVMPAVLSLIGGLLIYVIGKNKESRILVSVSIFVFTFMFLLGSGWGAIMRDTAEKHEAMMREVAESHKKSEKYLMKQAFIESQVNKFRTNLGLPPLNSGGNAEILKKSK